MARSIKSPRFLDSQALWIISIIVGGLMVIHLFSVLDEVQATGRVPIAYVLCSDKPNECISTSTGGL